jgi:cysteinyl-tRNA synthetase
MNQKSTRMLPHLKLYNTETRRKEEIAALDGKTIRMYTCGPTVYNYAHIGNFRTYVFEDLLRRTLQFFGFSLIQVMNITDVEDKIIKGAIQKGVSLKEYTEPYREAFFEDLKKLNIEPVEFYPNATDYIPEMIAMIQKLLEKGFAYRSSDGSIYFAIKSFPSYGRLSHLRLDELEEGASERVASDEYDKQHAADFVLWKSYDPQRDGGIFWESPFGKGRPGWHIECSAMAIRLLGESIDIHVGGVDNIFPHHENEIAQSEAFCCKHFVAHWLHAEHLLVDHKKMSKSLGNFYTLRDLLDKGFTGREVRYLLLHTHYRTQLNFSFQGLEGARASLERLSDFILRLQQIDSLEKFGFAALVIKRSFNDFTAALADDLNISPALASLFDLVREINILCDDQKIGKEEAREVLHLLKEYDRILGVLPLEKEEERIPDELTQALEKREAARNMKKWKEADHWRDFISLQGFSIEDTPSGARLKKRKP